MINCRLLVRIHVKEMHRVRAGRSPIAAVPESLWSRYRGSRWRSAAWHLVVGNNICADIGRLPDPENDRPMRPRRCSCSGST